MRLLDSARFAWIWLSLKVLWQTPPGCAPQFPTDPWRSTALFSSIHAVPAMSRCSHGVSSANSFRNMAALTAPPQRPPELTISAMFERMFSLYSSSSGRRQNFSPAFSSGAIEAFVHFFVVGKDSGVHIAERDHNRAGQRGGIDQMGATELAGVAEPVGEHQPAFGVGIDNLDRLAGHGDLYVAGLLRLARRHILRGANNRRDSHLRFEQRNAPAWRRSWRRRRPCHISSFPCHRRV